MQTATKILQPFLWAAVNLLALQMEEFLHMQVMSIGIGPQQKKQQEKYQQQKVLATLQKIILLARFFPNQHAIHSAGKKTSQGRSAAAVQQQFWNKKQFAALLFPGVARLAAAASRSTATTLT